jgi:hypothetical protein
MSITGSALAAATTPTTAGAEEVFVSRTARDVAAGSGIAFQDSGDHTLKGVPGTWQLFAARA